MNFAALAAKCAPARMSSPVIRTCTSSCKHKVKPMNDEFNDDLGTPTAEDLEQCYGSKYLGAADLGDRKIKSRIEKVRKETMQQQGGKPERPKLVLYFTTLDKGVVDRW
jgi:hypothetical protein